MESYNEKEFYVHHVCLYCANTKHNCPLETLGYEPVIKFNIFRTCLEKYIGLFNINNKFETQITFLEDYIKKSETKITFLEDYIKKSETKITFLEDYIKKSESNLNKKIEIYDKKINELENKKKEKEEHLNDSNVNLDSNHVSLVQNTVGQFEANQTITKNGQYTNYFTVNVPNRTEILNVTTNGTYTPTSPNIGFSNVTVNVPNSKLKLKYLYCGRFFYDLSSASSFTSQQNISIKPGNSLHFGQTIVFCYYFQGKIMKYSVGKLYNTSTTQTRSVYVSGGGTGKYIFIAHGDGDSGGLQYFWSTDSGAKLFSATAGSDSSGSFNSYYYDEINLDYFDLSALNIPGYPN